MAQLMSIGSTGTANSRSIKMIMARLKPSIPLVAGNDFTWGGGGKIIVPIVPDHQSHRILRD